MTIKLLRQQAITNAVLYNSPVITSTFMNLVMVIFKAVCGAVELYRPIQTGIYLLLSPPWCNGVAETKDTPHNNIAFYN